ncbi:hypothetical protein JCM2811A_02010 [Methylorubrum rhodinum]
MQGTIKLYAAHPPLQGMARVAARRWQSSTISRDVRRHSPAAQRSPAPKARRRRAIHDRPRRLSRARITGGFRARLRRPGTTVKGSDFDSKTALTRPAAGRAPAG